MECIQFHPTGMVWPPSARGLLVTEGVRGDGGVLKNRDGERFMFNYISPFFAAETADTIEEADQWYDEQEGLPPSAGAPAPRRGRPRDQLRGEGGPGQPARRRLPRHRQPPLGRRDPPAAALDVPPVQGARRRRHHHRRRWRSARRATTSWAACASRPTRRRRPWPASTRPARSPAACTASNRLGGNSLSDLIVFGRRAGLAAAERALGMPANTTVSTRLKSAK